MFDILSLCVKGKRIKDFVPQINTNLEEHVLATYPNHLMGIGSNPLTLTAATFVAPFAALNSSSVARRKVMALPFLQVAKTFRHTVSSGGRPRSELEEPGHWRRRRAGCGEARATGAAKPGLGLR